MIRYKPAEKPPSNFSQQKIKLYNMMMLFNNIRKNMPTSRAALAEETGLSPTTVSMLVDELISNKWIRETGAGTSSMRGRKPIMLEVNASGGCIATIEIISNSIICTLYDICFKKLDSIRIRGAKHTSEQIAHELRKLLKAKRVALYRLIGIHIIYPGIFDAETGRIQFSAVIPHDELGEDDFVASLRLRFPDARVIISNNTSVLAFMEYSSDHYTPGNHLLAVNIDEGISGGVVTGDAHKDPHRCFPLEIGHMIVDRNGPQCHCSNRGCLEAMCSIVALFRELNERAGMSLQFIESFGADINGLAMQQAAERFHSGDPRVLAVLTDYAYTLCCALVSIVNLFDIQTIHIGGAISALGEPFLEIVRATLHAEFRLFHSREVAIEASTGDFESMRRSAVLMCMDEIFQSAQA